VDARVEVGEDQSRCMPVEKIKFVVNISVGAAYPRFVNAMFGEEHLPKRLTNLPATSQADTGQHRL
jgi:hypothetical protein